MIDQSKIAEIYRLMESDVSFFAQLVCADLLTSKTAEFQIEMYDLCSRKERLAIAAPRGFTKSSIVAKIYPLWLSLFRKRKDITIISASETLAVEHLRYIRHQVETNNKINIGWGDLRSDKWTENHIVIEHRDGGKVIDKVNIRARGAGGQIRGFRPDCLILDDIETDESVESEEQRKKIKTWLFRACLNTLLPGGQLIIIGTLIHPLSVLSDILAMPNNWEKRKYRAYKDGIEDAGHELWPEARPHEWLQQRKKEIGSFAFASEFMNDPKLDESIPIKEDQIRYWETLPIQYSSFIAVDPAYSDDEQSDFKVAVLVLTDALGNRYLADYIRTHDPIGEFQDSVINMYLRNKSTVLGLGIPNTGVEKAFYESFLRKCDERKVNPPVIELKNIYTNDQTSVSKRNKKSRIIAALQPLFENGKYFIHADHIEAREELLTIGSSRWDDLCDAMCYAESIAMPHFYEPEAKKSVWEEQISRVPVNYGME